MSKIDYQSTFRTLIRNLHYIVSDYITEIDEFEHHFVVIVQLLLEPVTEGAFTV